MHVTEFHKRGLPHAHILIILAAQDRAITQDLVYTIVVAELPPSPEATEKKRRGKTAGMPLVDSWTIQGSQS